MNQYWHFESLRTQDPGLYTVRFTTPKSRRFFSVAFQVYRHLYVNSTAPFNCCSGGSGAISNNNGLSTSSDIKVKPLTGRYTLPRGLQQLHLLELEIQEEVFLRQKESIAASFHQTAAGIFERHVGIHRNYITDPFPRDLQPYQQCLSVNRHHSFSPAGGIDCKPFDS